MLTLASTSFVLLALSAHVTTVSAMAYHEFANSCDQSVHVYTAAQDVPADQVPVVGRHVGVVDSMSALTMGASEGMIVQGMDPVTGLIAGRYLVPSYPTIFRFLPNPISFECGFEVDFAGVPETSFCTEPESRVDHMLTKRRMQHNEPWAVAGRAATDRVRLKMNAKHPGMIPHWTEHGFKHIPGGLPAEAWEPLIEFYNKHRHAETPEGWKADNNYVNHWESPTWMIFLPWSIKKKVFNALQPMLEEWIGKRELQETACYGIRVYKNNSLLLNHVDVMETHVASAIVQIDQEVNEDWHLEVYSHDGEQHRLPLRPRDVVLYESASTIHGRPTPLNGTYFANTFVHFKPSGWDYKGDYS